MKENEKYLISLIIFLLAFLTPRHSFAVKTKLSKEEKALLDSFYNPNFDYSTFVGRVTDRDASSHILKVQSENGNTKFFHAGDKVRFHLVKDRDNPCEGYVRDVEGQYFVLYVKNIFPCFKKGDFIRRGTQLVFKSPILAERTKNASIHRVILLKRKKDYLGQLNNINNFIWSYAQQKVKVAAKFDQRILQVKQQKQKELDLLLVKKRDQIRIQQELMSRLKQLDHDLGHYRVEKYELFADQWALDQGLGLPVQRNHYPARRP